MAKANPTAAAGSEIVHFPFNALLLGGSEVDARIGGVVEAGGEVYSLSRPELIAGGDEAARGEQILQRRVGRITLADHPASQPTTFGGKAEYFALDPVTGDYSTRFGFDLELYNHMVEAGTRVAPDVSELDAIYREMSEQAVREAEVRGVILSPVSVQGQHEPTAKELSHHPYVTKTVANMDIVTGFSAAKIFRVCGFQPHTRISNLRAALQAAEAMQLIMPILASPQPVWAIPGRRQDSHIRWATLYANTTAALRHSRHD
jgi:hypothetical protein